MGVKIIRWRPWPPLISKKYEVKIQIQKLEGFNLEEENGGLAVEIRWKGPKFSLSSLRRNVKRNCTREETVKKRVNFINGDCEEEEKEEQNGGVLVEWDEGFQNVCSFSGNKENVFHPWEVNLTVLHALNQGAKNKISIIGLATLNLADYVSKTEEQLVDLKIPLAVSGNSAERRPSLFISLSFVELRAAQEPTEVVQSPMIPLTSPLTSGSPTDKDDVSALKAGLRKVKIFTDYVSIRRAKKARDEDGGSEAKSEAKSEEGEYGYPFDSDSLDEFVEGESDEAKDDSALRKSFSYGTLAFANYAGVSCYSNARFNNEDEDWIYYSNRRRSDVGNDPVEDIGSNVVSEQSINQNTKRSLLPWRKRKMSFRSPKAKGEPLLKKAYGEEGGDDIDFDRRQQLSSDESLSYGWHKTDEDSTANRSSVSEFGDDNFAVGTWEQKEITSRDGQMKIQTQVFFASIDQRSERAAGESACTALVAVIADWLQKNQNHMPIKSQFDSLIRDGSLEWRNLCENETYKARFPDKHFDLETVLQAQIRDICVEPGKSFIGFFHPEKMEEGNFDFLHGAMSFDDIWGEISRLESIGDDHQVFVVSWNDHFFVLKIESDAFYIIDTLGERLHEGCNQAYILKFDKETIINKLPSLEEKPGIEEITPSPDFKEGGTLEAGPEDPTNKEQEEEIAICQGKESCKEYIKSFLAAIPIRELQADMRKGLINSTPVHHRLQIEFHYTKLRQSEICCREAHFM